MHVTLVTPTLDAASFFPQLVRSLREATGPGCDLEHIVVDAGSSDQTQRLARDAGARVVELQGSSMYEALNHGLDLASGELFGYVNADDELTPGALATIQAYFSASPRTRWIVGPAVLVDARGATMATLGPPPRLSAARFRALGWSCFPQPSTFFRTDFARELGGFDTRYRLAGDYDLFARALERCRPQLVDHPLSRFRLHGQNLSTRQRREMLRESRMVAGDARLGVPLSTLLRLMTKVEVNARNPGWALAKLMGRIQY